MRISSVDEELYTNNTSGKNFGVTMGAKLFSVLTESLYKDKPRAVCRETIANCVDAHRMRDELFAGLEKGSDAWNDLLAFGYSEPGTPFKIHLPTEIEPWLEFEDFGIGLPVEKVLGEKQFTIDPKNPNNPTPILALDEEGHPIRSGGVYTTLFGSDKEDNNNAIGAYGLGCKSPFAIVDTFLVTSRVNGEEHRYLMFLNSKREPSVEWLTKDPVTGEPSPFKTDKKNGICVRMDGIPVTLKNKISDSVSEILQTIPTEEQPIVNDGLFTFKSVVYEEFIHGLKIVNEFHYGHIFEKQFVVNSGGIVYPVDTNKLEDVFGPSSISLLQRHAGGRCIVIEMPLGTVNIPPSREEISYDDTTIENICNVLRPAVDHINKLINDIIQNMELNVVSMWKTKAELKKLDPQNSNKIIQARWEILLDEMKKKNKSTDIALHFGREKVKTFVKFSDKFKWLTKGRDFRIYQQNYSNLRPVYMDDYAFSNGNFVAFVAPQSHMIIDVTEMSDRNAIVVLNDTPFSRNTILSRMNRLNEEGKNELFEGLIREQEPIHADKCGSYGNFPPFTIFVGESKKGSEIEFERYLEFTEHLCKHGNFNYVLGSEVINIFEKTKRDTKVISKSEIERNLKEIKFSRRSGYKEFNVSPDIFEPTYTEEGDLEINTFILRDEFRLITKRLSNASDYFLEYMISRGVLGERTFVVNGIRTQSRLMVESLPHFKRIDTKAFLEVSRELELSMFECSLTKMLPGRDPIAQHGFKSIFGALLFSHCLCLYTDFRSLCQFLQWLQFFVNRHKDCSFEENDLAFRHYGKFSLGDLYGKIVQFSKILYIETKSKYPRARVPLHRESGVYLTERWINRSSGLRFSLLEKETDILHRFAEIGVVAWKEDLELLAQLEAAFREKYFKTFHGTKFPTFSLKRGMIEENATLQSKLVDLESKLTKQLSKVFECCKTLETDKEFYAIEEASTFIKRLKDANCRPILGELNFKPLKWVESLYEEVYDEGILLFDQGD